MSSETIFQMLFPQELPPSLHSKTLMDFGLISGVMIGIQVCNLAMAAMVNPFLMKIGVKLTVLAMNWSKIPFLGIIFVPLFGAISDSCNWKSGPRRPFILFFSVGIIEGLIIFPTSKALGLYLDNGDANNNFGAILAATGAVLINFGCEACQSLMRVFMIEVTIPNDHARGLGCFTLLAGLGGLLVSIPSVKEWEVLFTYFEDYQYLIFFALLMEFVSLLFYTLRSYGENQRQVLCEDVKKVDPATEQLLAFYQYLRSILTLPTNLQWLVATQFFSWISLLSYMIYAAHLGEEATPLIDIFGMTFLPERSYIDVWGVFFFYLACIHYSGVLAHLIKFIALMKSFLGARDIYIGSLLFFAMAALLMAFFRSPLAAAFLAAAAGVQFAVLQSLPFILMARYHRMDPSCRGRGLGTDIAVLSSTVFLAQILLDRLVGPRHLLYVLALCSGLAVATARRVACYDM